MSGKQHKREAKRARDAVREAARRRERQRNLWTGIIVAVIFAIGGAIIAATMVSERRAEQELASAASEAAESATAQAETQTALTPLPAEEACAPEPAPPLDEKPAFADGPEQVLADGEDYRAVVETSCGRMVFDLYAQDAPETVNSFVFLAEQGFYDGLEIFRNSTGIGILQSGSGTNQAAYDVGYDLPNEFARAEAEGGYGPGALALANTGQPDSGGSQFFLVYGDSPLPPQYTLFGQLVEGEDVLRSIGAIPTQDPSDPANETPSAQVFLESVTIERVPGDQP